MDKDTEEQVLKMCDQFIRKARDSFGNHRINLIRKMCDSIYVTSGSVDKYLSYTYDLNCSDKYLQTLLEDFLKNALVGIMDCQFYF
jgi:hypothetical protein